MTLHLELDLTVHLSPLNPEYTPSREEMLEDLSTYFRIKGSELLACNGTKIELSEKDILDVEEI